MPYINDKMAAIEAERSDREALGAENTLSNDNVEGLVLRLDGSRFAIDIEAVERHLAEEIVGQDEACAIVRGILEIVAADLADPRKPLATVLFMGPTGVGKTEIVRALTRVLHGDADMLNRVDMNTLSQEHYAASLTGAPPGYVGSKEGSTVFDQELLEGRHGKPAIVLFDELEKASPEVILALLNIFDNGIMTVASGGRTYTFRKAIIFMTSNLGTASAISEERSSPFERVKRLFAGRLTKNRSQGPEDELLQRFPPEFVNRIDRIHTFSRLDEDVQERLIEAHMGRLNKRLKRRGLELTLDESVFEHLRAEGFDKRFGARALARQIRAKIELPLARHLLSGNASQLPNGGMCRLFAEFEDGSVRFVALSG
ncbi:AAA family ATPase [Fulvimarina sp. MAC8]|uniref:AAA family ATPase n=1 Tax=Fulvimarina sp. MAC8 TaxID=3162874 RepID=UPI0032EE4F87